MRLALHDSVHDAVDRLVGISPEARVVDAKLRALIEQRDRGCTVPGCEHSRWLHIHHIVHYEHGGPTIPSNLLALCPYHHRLHHLGLLGIEGDPEKQHGMRFTNKWGRPIGAAPPTPPPAGRALPQAAGEIGVPAGNGWHHPWGIPLEARMFGWRH